ncbi:bidirectional hydrogenase complex protein HoxE [Desulfopila sp. IMCC35006]|uniref:bidirectional hydrogenase complex protein HoxE n=1 Tax=Desulfopila sp. IMCC35006 TaxID=2569542 RepID=UPI0010AD03F9|nr:bidirectional hydrogenase complex protein HoxE [Desulfopila sp. IMCC35006]TKB24307.1 bidirectional hydrogenase complex protein HoxE [Desulfopila sp. IMCC35006]
MLAEGINPNATALPATSPAQDHRLRMVNRTMQLYRNEPHGLIETLHTVQESFGYLEEPILRYVAAALQVPLSRVYAVATFYHSFTLRPPGEHTCVICRGTACYIGGSGQILDRIKEKVGIATGETTADGKVSLLEARCLGSCGLAPAGVFDGEVTGKLSPEKVLEKIGRWQHHDPEH